MSCKNCLNVKLRCLAHKRYKSKNSFSLWNNPLFEDPTNRTLNNLLFEGVSPSYIEDFDNQSQSKPVTNKESSPNPFDSSTYTNNGHATRQTTLQPADINLPSKNGVQGATKKGATASVLMNHETRKLKIPQIIFFSSSWCFSLVW